MWGQGPPFNNNGMLIKASSGESTIESDFFNLDSVNVTSGTLSIGLSATSGSSSGSFMVGGGSELELKGSHTLLAASTLEGSGALTKSSGGTSVIEGAFTLSGPVTASGSGGLTFDTTPVTLGALTVSGGNLTLTSAIDVTGAFLQSGGTVNGSATLTAMGMFTWSGGFQSGNGATVASGGVAFSGSATKRLDMRSLSLDSAVTWSDSGEIWLENGTTLTSSVSFDIQNDERLRQSGAVSIFNNVGAMTKSGAGGQTRIAANFNNEGSLGVTSGNLRFDLDFAQANIGELDVRIAGLAEFDVYTVIDAATLGGTLDIILDGFEPEIGATFVIMTFDSRVANSEFDTVNGDIIGNGKRFDVLYGATNVTLEVVADP